MTRKKRVPVIVEQQPDSISHEEDSLIESYLAQKESDDKAHFEYVTNGGLVCGDTNHEHLPKEVILPEPRKIKLNEVMALPKPGGVDAVPDSNNPFYVVAKDGLFLHIKSLLGRAIIKSTNFPVHLPELGETGWFEFNATKIPAALCSQIVDFFKTVFEMHKTEAEVVLLIHRQTKEWAVMVPTQRVSYSAVDSRVDPTRVPKDFLIVGTMHSHCDFGAFHSGTDTDDADDMNGVHLTIGHITREMPEVASMVSMNGVHFTFKPEELADFSGLNSVAAPKEWLDYVIPTANLTSGHKPLGYNLFEKYPKTVPKPVVPPVKKWLPPTNPYQYGQQNSQWGKYLLPENATSPDWKKWQAEDDDYYDWVKDTIGGKSTDYKKEDEYYDWLATHARYDDNVETKDWKNWNVGLNNNLIDAIIDSGCVTDEDMEFANENSQDAGTSLLWRNMFLNKLSSVSVTLKALGIDVSYQVTVRKDSK